jgi:hypothetical protein
VITIRGGRAQDGLWILWWPLSFIAYIYIEVASTSGPSSPSSHERMDHDPLSKFNAL